MAKEETNKYFRLFILCRSGASAVEFALISPVLVFILCATIGYGLLFSTAISVNQLGADITRATIGGLTLAEKQTLATTHLEVASSDYFLLEADQVKVDVSYDDAAEKTIVHVIYDPKNHPIRLFEGILPIPSRSFEARQSISEHSRG